MDMNTTNKLQISEEMLSDIILCEPVTRKGLEALGRLGLSDVITVDYFYEHLRVESKFEIGKKYESQRETVDDSDNILYYQYTVSFEQFENAQKRLAEFDSRFKSDVIFQSPLLMLGVAGNGKSIEINRRIHEVNKVHGDLSQVYIDLENAKTKIKYVHEFECPNKNDAIWLLSIKIFDRIMTIIQNITDEREKINSNYQMKLKEHFMVNETEQEIFDMIYGNINNNNVPEIFNTIVTYVKDIEPQKALERLLELLILILFCTNPSIKHYIVIDNIEQYIILNDSKIQIPDSNLSTIYRTIKNVTTNMSDCFNRISNGLIWKILKVIIVLRRTSIGLLDSSFLQYPINGKENINDFTGYFQIEKIWKKKKTIISNKIQKSGYQDSDSKMLLELAGRVLEDGEQARGTSYQSLIAPLMSYGIRRNALSQAHSIFKTYKTLKRNDKQTTIDHQDFVNLFTNIGPENNTVQYMFRRALIEFQFKWAISSEDSERWSKLNLGHLCGKDIAHIGDMRINIEKVEYYDNSSVSLVRRVLSYLSNFVDSNGRKSIVDMFKTCSLYDLIEGVLYSPYLQREIKKEEYVQLSRVLIALSNMANDVTKSAPYIILGINDPDFHNNPTEDSLAEILERIWAAKKVESMPEKKYNCCDFGVRINDAGHSFLLDWQPSFSFMASLYCYTIPPLFFLKDIDIIKYVINQVYFCAFDLVKKYENEALQFCGTHNQLGELYCRPRRNNKQITIRSRIVELHVKHLQLYRSFLQMNYENLGIKKRDVEFLTKSNGFISKTIAKYQEWKERDDMECF